jgi:hypothetical protein
VLVADKEKARRKYKNAVVDDATIDDMLTSVFIASRPFPAAAAAFFPIIPYHSAIVEFFDFRAGFLF